eukprot:scaffold11335_cov66-Phaeocystis_antarctica.AAC.1
MPFIACAIGINCARSCSVLCPMIDARSPRTQPAPIVTGSSVNVEFSRLCLDKKETVYSEEHINGLFCYRVAEGTLDVLPAQPAHASPHLRPERTLHGIVDCGALERLGGTIEIRQQDIEDLSPHCTARAELRGRFLAEGANKEALAEPSRPQAPQYAQPRRAHKREQERDGNPNAAQAQQPPGQQHG